MVFGLWMKLQFQVILQNEIIQGFKAHEDILVRVETIDPTTKKKNCFIKRRIYQKIS
jgi:hypothetical protein